MAIDLNELATAIGQLELRFRMRRRLKADWTSGNEILLSAEWGLETDTGKLKIGDGVTAWTALTYIKVGVMSIVPGTGVAVDNTDPANPVLSASGGGGGSNLTPDSHPGTATAWDDEFELGSALDTTGARATGANAWTWQQQNTATVAIGKGNIVMTAQLTASNVPNAIEQSLPSPLTSSWVIKGGGYVPQSQNFNGVFHLRESATGKIFAFGLFNNSGTPNVITAVGTMAAGYSSVVDSVSSLPGIGQSNVMAWQTYWKIDLTTTTMNFSISGDGLVWRPVGSVKNFSTYFTTAPDKVGMVVRAGSATSPGAIMSADYFRRTS